MDELNFPTAIFFDKNIVQRRPTKTPDADQIADEAYQELFDRAAQSEALGIRFEEAI